MSLKQSRSLALTLAAGLIAAAPIFGAVPAQAHEATSGHASVSCGASVTGRVTLQHDLVNCSGPGLIVGADDTRINLNGFTISGIASREDVGIDIGSRNGVSVSNGRIEKFGIGIRVVDSERVRVQALRLVDLSQFGILLFGSSQGVIRRNHITHAGANRSGGAGILLAESSANQLRRNRIRKSGHGIDLFDSSSTTIYRNVLSNNGVGVGLVESDLNRIVHNVTDRNTDAGIRLGGRGDSNVIQHNFGSGNGFAGIAVDESSNTTVRRNVTNDNLGAGIAILEDATGSLVTGNRAHRNGGGTPAGCVPLCSQLGDGIHVAAPGTVVTDNSANRNSDLGIEAVTGIADGGRNTARNNGDPRQCLGVSCNGGA
jgi:parallel beta-helix repeat protein